MRSLTLPKLLLLFPAALCAQTADTRLDKPHVRIPTDAMNPNLPRGVRLSGEERLRIEGFTGGGFQEESEDAYLLSRFRFNLAILPVNWMKFRFQVQDARLWWKNTKPYAPPYQDTFDLRLASVEFGDSEKQPVALRVGRQEINLGEERLVGSSSWTNTARTFDAARLTLRTGRYRVDAFAASPVVLQDGNVGDHVPGNNLHGLYGSMDAVVPRATVEPYVFWRLIQRQKTEAGSIGNLSFAAVGMRWVGKLSRDFDYGQEVTIERGSLGPDRVAAWAGHWMFGYNPPWIGSPRAFAEYNHASGDRNPKDGMRNTFDQLFPSGHDKEGLADQVGWRNICHLRLGIESKPRPGWMASVRYSGYWLADVHDALYNSSGTALFRRVDGSAGRFVGTELDTVVLYRYSKQLQLGIGFAHLFPGTFLKRTTPGTAYNYPYLMLSTTI
jgi:hypothetical protein